MMLAMLSSRLDRENNFTSFFEISDRANRPFVRASCHGAKRSFTALRIFSIYTLSDLDVLSNLIGSLSLANEHYSPPTE